MAEYQHCAAGVSQLKVSVDAISDYKRCISADRKSSINERERKEPVAVEVVVVVVAEKNITCGLLQVAGETERRR